MAHVYVVMDSEDGLQGAFTSVSKAYAISSGTIGAQPKDLKGARVSLDDVQSFFRTIDYGVFFIYGPKSSSEIWKLELNRWM